MYVGRNYEGLVTQAHTQNTVEHHIFTSLLKALLIISIMPPVPELEPSLSASVSVAVLASALAANAAGSNAVSLLLRSLVAPWASALAPSQVQSSN